MHFDCFSGILNLHNKKIGILCIFRFSDSDVNIFIGLHSEALLTIGTKCEAIILAGDLNIIFSRRNFLILQLNITLVTPSKICIKNKKQT